MCVSHHLEKASKLRSFLDISDRIELIYDDDRFLRVNGADVGYQLERTFHVLNRAIGDNSFGL